MRPIILAAKHDHRRDLLRDLGRALGLLVAELAGPEWMVSWVPASPAQRRRRGYDQGRELARALSRDLRLPTRCLLKRRSGPAQVGLDRQHRLVGPDLRLAGPACPRHVVLVDDVTTTGATLSAASAVLRSGGATTVRAVVVAATPSSDA